MKHDELKELLPLYIDGGLDEDEVKFVERHLAECEECRQALANYQQNFDFLSTAEDIEVSSDFLASVMRRVRDEQTLNERVEEEAEFPEAVINRRRSDWWGRAKELFQWRVRIPVGAMGLAAVAVFFFILMGPLGRLLYAPAPGVPQEELQYGQQQMELYKQDLSNVQMDRNVAPSRSMAPDQMAKEQSFAAPTPTEGLMDIADVERKIIQNANLRVEVRDIDKASKEILKIVENLQGFVANSGKWEAGNNQQFGNFQLRVPAENFYQAIEQIEGLGEVKNRSINGTDVTEEYIDIESRLKNLKLQEERYRELLDQATKVEEILKIEKELERVRSSIESLQGRINYYDNRISMSTIDLELMEPEPLTPNNWGIWNALKDAVRAMGDTLYGLIVRIGRLLPYLLLLVLIYVIYRIFRRRR